MNSQAISRGERSGCSSARSTNAEFGANFPAGKLASWTQYQTYCRAAGLFISPCYNAQKTSASMVDEIMQLTNSAPFFSEGLLKIVPYGDTAITGNGATFTPNVTPVYDLTDDDFVIDHPGQDPVLCVRKDPADAFNHVQLEFLNRNNKYSPETTEAKDQAQIDAYGLRPYGSVSAHMICLPSIAKQAAQLILQRQCYIRNEYQFKLNWSKCLLEPMDIVTLTDPGLGLNLWPVRITSTEEDEDGIIAITAEDFPAGVVHASLYGSQAGAGYLPNYNVAPGNVTSSLVFEPPLQLAGDAEIWFALTGGANWGGANIWVSTDNVNFEQAGAAFGKSRTPIIRLNTITTPKYRGSIPAFRTMGKRMGVRTRMVTPADSKQPTISRKTLIIRSVQSGSVVQDCMMSTNW